MAYVYLIFQSNLYYFLLKKNTFLVMPIQAAVPGCHSALKTESYALGGGEEV